LEDLKWDQTKAVTNQNIFDILVNRKADLADISAPDTHFTYCNTNYALLALLIEKISGITYPQFIKKTFFDPLQMNNSFVFTAADSLRETPNYDFRGNAINNNYLDFVYGDKNIYTTPRDLLLWHRALSSNVLFSDSTLKLAYEPQSHEKKGSRNYGLGWRMTLFPNNKKVIFHNGWWHGNNASFIRLLEEDITIIVLGNRYNPGIYKAHHLINSLSDSFYMKDNELQ
jgi:CubicO group peptidase (beta-lactamase class C family)